MPLINCEISFELKGSVKCFLVASTVAGEEPTFTTFCSHHKFINLK